MPLGGGSTKTNTVTSSSNSAPWAPTQPGLQTGIGDLGSLYGSGGFNIPYFPGETVAGTSPLQTQSWNATAATAGDPSKGVGAAQTYNNNILSGNYDALHPMFQAATDAANGNFEAAGRYGSGANAKAVGSGVANVIAQASGQAAGQAPGLAAGQYIPSQMLDTAGQEQQATAQNQINGAIQKYNYQQGEPINAIQQYMQSLSGNWGGTTSGAQTQPVYYPSGSSQGLGALMGLGSLGLQAYGSGMFG